MIDVGIVIPSYNAARFLPAAIQSIREQTFASWKCVIVDDCSTDDSREIAKAATADDARFSLLCLDANLGTSAARNAGLSALIDSVRYVIFLDSDDVWNAFTLSALVSAIESRPSWVAVFGNCRLVDHDGAYVHSPEVESACRELYDWQDGRLVRTVGADEATFCQLLFKNPIVSPGCILIRADVIARITGKITALFDAELELVEDLDAWFRIRRAGCIGHVDQLVLDYRQHSSNKSNKRWAMAVSARKVRMKALSRLQLDDQEFHDTCAAFRGYRRARIGIDLRSAAASLRKGELRTTAITSIRLGMSALDVFTIRICQLSRWAKRLVGEKADALPESSPVAVTDAADQFYDPIDG